LDETGINRLEDQIKEAIKCLGGIHAEPKFYRSYKWTVNNKDFQMIALKIVLMFFQRCWDL